MTARLKNVVSALALAAAAIGPAAAQPALAAAAQIAAGAKVSDTKGGVVGTITAVDGEFVTLKTDKHEARVPAASFTAVEGGLLFGMTQAEFNADIEKSIVDPKTLMKVGATVRDTAGGLVGTIEAVEADLATVKLPNLVVKLPVNVFAASGNDLIIGSTAAELEAQVQATGAGES